MIEVVCKSCHSKIYVTDKDSLKRWTEHGETCFHCKRKQKLGEEKKPSSVKIDVCSRKPVAVVDPLVEKMQKVFEALAENYKRQDSLYNTLFDLIKKHYGVKEWFTDFLYNDCEFAEYFEILDNLNKKDHWVDFKKWMEAYETKKKEAV